eukprot:452209-Pleurochrysis_carterae.AAC.1
MPPAPLPASIIKEFADGKSNLAISGFELEIVRTVNVRAAERESDERVGSERTLNKGLDG